MPTSAAPARIDRFSGRYRFLSNFYPSGIYTKRLITGKRIYVRTVEHGYQAAKRQDQSRRFEVIAAKKPGDAKALGQLPGAYADWDERKYEVMLYFVREKFRQNPDLAEMLLATGDAELIEGNTWGDTYWGVCRGVGENNLGKILMIVREEIRSERKSGAHQP